MPFSNKTTIKVQLYDELKSRILRQRYAPGEKLVIDSLARELAVSNTPLREALVRLESDGLVVTTPNSGIRVVTLNAKTVYSIQQTGYALLIGGYDLCRQMRLEKKLLALMEKKLGLQMIFHESGDEMKFIRAGLAFDRSFVEATGNERLTDLFDRQADVFFLAVARRNRDMRQRTENIQEHNFMIEAVRNEDARAVKDALAWHCRLRESAPVVDAGRPAPAVPPPLDAREFCR